MVKLSILVAVYNTATSLSKCIDSILASTFNDFEIIIVDDASTDNSYAICEEYTKKYPNIIKLYHLKKNKGCGYAKAEALSHANGEYIMIIDSDDFIEPHYLENMFKYAKENNDADFIKNVGMSIDGEGEEKNFGVANCMLNGNLIKRSLFNNFDFPRIRISEDCAINEILPNYASNRLLIEDKGYHYVLHNTSTIHSSSKKLKSFYDALFMIISYDHAIEKGLFVPYTIWSMRNSNFHFLDYGNFEELITEKYYDDYCLMCKLILKHKNELVPEIQYEYLNEAVKYYNK